LLVTTVFHLMYTLYPPLDSESETSENKRFILSTELRESFQTLSSIHRAQNRLRNVDNPMKSHITEREKIPGEDSYKKETPPKPKHALTTLKERMDLQQIDIALFTTMMVEREVSRLQNGITELEKLLQQNSGVRVVDNVIPLQPTIVNNRIKIVDKAGLSVPVESEET